MKKRIPNQTISSSLPATPAVFSNAMRETLRGIAQAEGQKEGQAMQKHLTKRRILLYIIVAVLLVSGVAIAAALLTGTVFDYTLGTTPENAQSMIQYDLAGETIGDAEVKVTQAAYDGMSLFVAFSIRDLNATEPLGVYDDLSGMRLLREGDYASIADMGVGWWVDHIWIDGQPIDMPAMSSVMDIATETPGEILYSMLLRLDQEEVYLDGKSVEISMPIGERQSLDSLVKDSENGQIALPEKGMIAFTLDCSIRDRVVRFTPEWETIGERWRAKVRSAIFTPIQTYVTVDWAVDEDVMAAFIAENGEGYPDGNGGYYWMYDGVDAVGNEIQSLQLVDQNGTPVIQNAEGFYGSQGTGATVAYFTFPYVETLPDELYMAPTIGGDIDMGSAIRIK